MAMRNLYQTIDRVVLVTTGNTLINYGDNLKLTTIDNKYTTNYKEDGTLAYLNIKDDVMIVEAYLVTNMTFKNDNIDLEDKLEDDIVLVTPNGEYSISAPAHFIIKNLDKAVIYYDIKDYIESSRAGYYGVKMVPVAYDNKSMTCGFTIFVVYKAKYLPINYTFIKIGPSPVDSVTDYMIQFSGFNIKEEQGYLTAIGNALGYTGSNNLEIGKTRYVYEKMGSNRVGISPNNNIDYFFASQVNIADPTDAFLGLINPKGTNGINNSDNYLKTYKENDRIGYDLAYVDLKKYLSVGQRECFIRLSTTDNDSKIAVDGLAISLNTDGGSLDIVNNTTNITAKINEEKTISYEITNDSDVDISELVYYMNLNESLTFVKGSMTLDGETIEGDLKTGFKIGDIKKKEVKNIEFRIMPIKAGTDLTSRVKMNYSFLLYEGKTIYEETVGDSLVLNVLDNSTAFLELEYSVDNNNIGLNETFVSYLSIINKGTTTANNIRISDILPAELEFIENSVIYNGKQTDYNILDGFLIDHLEVLGSARISFETKAIKTSDGVDNKISARYDYIDINGLKNDALVSSNNLVLSIMENTQPDVSVDITYNPSVIKVDDKITYNIAIKNNGDIPIYNVNIKDELPATLEFVDNSIKINNKAVAMNINEGIIINKIDKGELVNISFDILAITPGNNIKNSAEVGYLYENALGNHKGISHSNVLMFDVEKKDVIDFNIYQTTSKETVALGGVNRFNITVQNMGNVVANKVILNNMIASNYEYIDGSLIIDGDKSDQKINDGIILNNLKGNEEISISFSAKAISLADNVKNTINGEFRYTDSNNKEDVVIVLSNNDNTHVIEAKEAAISVSSTNNKGTQELNKKIVYKIELENIGDTLGSNIIIKDKLNDGLEFIKDSVSIDGVIQADKNIIEGITIKELKLGQKMAITYDVMPIKVNENITNEVSVKYSFLDTDGEEKAGITGDQNVIDIVDIFDPNVDLHFTVNAISNTLNDPTINQVVIKNDGNTPAFNLILKASYSDNYEYINDTLKVNNEIVYGDLRNGINLNELRVGEEVVITYALKGVNIKENNNNKVDLVYSYFDGDGKEITKNITSKNIVTKIVESDIADLDIVKLACYKVLPVAGINTYTISIKNIGNTVASEVLVKDIIDSNFEEVDNSIKINGKMVIGTINNLLIGDIKPQDVIIIEFQALAKIAKKDIINIAHVEYTYEDEKNIIYNVKEESNMVENTIIKDVSKEVIELLNNIAKKENGITDLLEQETAKINKALEITDDKDKILDVNESVKEMIATLKKTEATTKDNLENIIKLLTM